MKPSRRTLLASAAVPFCGCTAFDGSSTPARSPSRDCIETDDAVWPSFQCDAHNTGAASTVPELESEPEVRALTGDFVFHAGVVLDEARMYVVYKRGIEAFDRADGSRAWTHDLDEIANTRAALACGTVIVQTTYGLRGVDAVEGTERWRLDGGSGISEPSIAVVPNGVAVGTVGAALIDPATGEATWEISREYSTLGLGADDDTLYLTTVGANGDRAAVVAYGLESGEHRWTYDEIEFQTNTSNVSDPVIGDELVYVVDTDGRLRAIEKDGSLAWSHSFRELTVIPQPVLHPSGTLVMNVGNSRQTVAFDAATGDVEWKTRMSHFGSECPLVGGDVVYTDTGRGLRALSIADGSELWHLTTVRAEHPMAATGRSLLAYGSQLCELTPAD